VALSLNSFGSDFFMKTHEKFVTSSSKEELESLRFSLQMFLNKFENKKININQQIQPIKNGFKLNIEELTPIPFKNLLSKSQKNGEANCYNTALVALKILPHIRYSSPSEFSFYIHSPLCKKISMNNNFIPGDLIDFEGGHAAIFLTPSIIFNKKSNDIGSPWKFDNSQNRFDYSVDFNRLKRCDLDPEYCQSFSIYRCIPLSDFLKLNPQDKRLMTINDELSKIEFQYEQITLNTKRIRNKKLKEWQTSLNNLKYQLEQIDSFSFEEEHDPSKFYYNSLFYRLRALTKAMDNIFPII
jgi:hypothetical protein